MLTILFSLVQEMYLSFKTFLTYYTSTRAGYLDSIPTLVTATTKGLGNFQQVTATKNSGTNFEAVISYTGAGRVRTIYSYGGASGDIELILDGVTYSLTLDSSNRWVNWGDTPPSVFKKGTTAQDLDLRFKDTLVLNHRAPGGGTIITYITLETDA